MAYERIDGPKGLLYHYTKRENIEPILQDGRIRKFKDRECWFCTSLEDALRLMELTVMEEGKLYYDANGLPRRYPKFVPDVYKRQVVGQIMLSIAGIIIFVSTAHVIRLTKPIEYRS